MILLAWPLKSLTSSSRKKNNKLAAGKAVLKKLTGHECVPPRPHSVRRKCRFGRGGTRPYLESTYGIRAAREDFS